MISELNNIVILCSDNEKYYIKYYNFLIKEAKKILSDNDIKYNVIKYVSIVKLYIFNDIIMKIHYSTCDEYDLEYTNIIKKTCSNC